MTASETITIGARGSTLSVWQAEWVRDRLTSVAPVYNYEVQLIKTLGDKIQDAPLSKIGSTGLFVKEIEQALLDGKIDLAVHSLKDLPTDVHPGFVIVAAGPREDPRDVLVSKLGLPLDKLPPGARVGTSSLRRSAQILNRRPDLEILDLRGNVDTRLRKAMEGDYDAVVLAAAGIIRMGLAHVITEYLSPEVCLPAIGQGVIGAEGRRGDERCEELLGLISYAPVEVEMTAERSFMRELEGGCQVPIGALATVEGDEIMLQGMVASVDGQRLISDTVWGRLDEAHELGIELAGKLKAMGADEILDEIRGRV